MNLCCQATMPPSSLFGEVSWLSQIHSVCSSPCQSLTVTYHSKAARKPLSHASCIPQTQATGSWELPGLAGPSHP